MPQGRTVRHGKTGGARPRWVWGDRVMPSLVPPLVSSLARAGICTFFFMSPQTVINLRGWVQRRPNVIAASLASVAVVLLGYLFRRSKNLRSRANKRLAVSRLSADGARERTELQRSVSWSDHHGKKLAREGPPCTPHTRCARRRCGWSLAIDLRNRPKMPPPNARMYAVVFLSDQQLATLTDPPPPPGSFSVPPGKSAWRGALGAEGGVGAGSVRLGSGEATVGEGIGVGTPIQRAGDLGVGRIIKPQRRQVGGSGSAGHYLPWEVTDEDDMNAGGADISPQWGW